MQVPSIFFFYLSCELGGKRNTTFKTGQASAWNPSVWISLVMGINADKGLHAQRESSTR